VGTERGLTLSPEAQEEQCLSAQRNKKEGVKAEEEEHNFVRSVAG
jgi:hypothetical protein